MDRMRTIAEAKTDPRGLLTREVEKFTGRWYLDRIIEKFIFIYGFLSLLATVLYLGYLLIK